MRNNLEFKKFYNDALERLRPDERDFECNKSKLEYKYSLYALAEYFFKLADAWPKNLKSSFKAQGLTQNFNNLNNFNNNKILIAVSGGGDSIALLWLMRTFYPGEIIAAHVNHCLRGSESDGDEDFVKTFAAELNLKFISARIDINNLKFKSESLEEAARRLRHEWLINTANKFNACGIALGHNRDDLAETVLFNILRGSGIRGGVGMPEARGLFFRPLLGLRRNFLRELLRARNISWREDSTNQDINSSTRNFVRLELMPLIENKINNNAIEHLANFAEEMRASRESEERRGQDLFDKLLIERSFNKIVLKRDKLRALSEPDIILVIREAGRKLNLKTLSRVRTLELAGLIKKYKSDNSFVFQWQKDFIVKYENNNLNVSFVVRTF
ncbi:MAG: tRNA lysidine(34) synthetase TilS [Synergistaceae bacterium]|nr:tRNA lysidine(34) synthetase TilS [Synergistaceae bacterium]